MMRERSECWNLEDEYVPTLEEYSTYLESLDEVMHLESEL